MKTVLLAAAAAVVTVLPSSGSAQSPAPCDPGQTAAVQVTTKDVVHRKKDAPLYATHEVLFSANVTPGATNVQLTPEPGVKVLKPGSNGQRVDLVIPAPPSLTITVSWDQSDGVTQCSASKTLTFPVLSAKPPTIKLMERHAPRSDQVHATFVVKPARSGESLSPIEVTLRTSARPELPSSHARAHRFTVPMRPGDRKHYAKRLPAFTESLGQARACHYWYLSCGAVLSRVLSMHVFPGTLPPSQPSRWAAPFGILVTTAPSRDRFGFDVQARQDGRLIARFQRAGVCRAVPGPFGTFGQTCKVTALKNFPR